MKLKKNIPQRHEGDRLDVDVGPWRIERELARGSISVVFIASHRPSGAPAALKTMTWGGSDASRFHSRFEHEIRNAARLSHSNIAEIYDYGELSEWDVDPEDSGLLAKGPFFVMELARYGGIDLLSDDQHRWPVVRDILASVLDSLAHAHARQVLHRDIKPSNILLGRDFHGQVRTKLVDFGLASVFEALADPDESDIVSGGGPRYMAPEQFRSNWREYGGWTDLYALGAIAWELLCATPPYTGDSTLELAVKHTEHDLPEFAPVIDVPDGTEAWLRRMLAKEPADRYRFASDALRQLPAFGSDDEEAGLQLIAPDDDEAQSADDANTFRYPTLGNIALENDDSVDIPEEFTPLVSFDQLSEDDKKVGETGATSIPDPPDFDEPEDWAPPDTNEGFPSGSRHELDEVQLELVSLWEPPLVGRDRERDTLWDALLDTLATKDRHRIAITGALGIGKSHLARWLRQRAHELGLAQGIHVQWPKHGRDSQSTGLSRMLRDILNTDGASPEAAAERIERWFERHPSPDTGEGATIAPLIDDTPSTNRTKHTLTHVAAAVLNWLVVDPPIRYRRVRLRSADQKAAVAARFIERMAARRPVVLQIDDPHTEEAHAFLRELRTIQQPVLGVVTADTSRFTADDELKARLDNVCQKRIPLEPLSSEHQKFLLSRVLSVSPGLTDQIIRQTGGNPRLAIDTVKNWATRDFLEQTQEGFKLTESAEPRISDDVAQTVRHHLQPILDNEPESVVRATELCAIGGTHGDRRDWEDVCHRANLPYPDGLIQTFTREKILSQNGANLHFENALAHQALLGRAREGDRFADYHSVWADICKERGAGPERIAHHLTSAGRLREALDPLVRTMNLSGWKTDLNAALRCLSQLGEIIDTLDLPADHPAKIEYHLGRAKEARTVSGDAHSGFEHAKAALEGAKTLNSDYLIGDALVQTCRFAADRDRTDFDIRDRIANALDYLDPELHPDRWRGAVVCLVTYLIFSEGKRSHAVEIIDEHLAHADDLPAREAVTLYKTKARAAFHAEQFDDTLDAIQAGIEVAHTDDLTQAQYPLYNIAASVHFERGELEHAEQLARETLKLGQCEPSVETHLLELTLADILLARGKDRAAYDRLTQLPSITEEQLRSAYPEPYHQLLATAACRLSRWEEATTHIEATFDTVDGGAAATPERKRMFQQLLDAASDHPDRDLVDRLRSFLKPLAE